MVQTLKAALGESSVVDVEDISGGCGSMVRIGSLW